MIKWDELDADSKLFFEEVLCQLVRASLRYQRSGETNTRRSVLESEVHLRRSSHRRDVAIIDLGLFELIELSADGKWETHEADDAIQVIQDRANWWHYDEYRSRLSETRVDIIGHKH